MDKLKNIFIIEGVTLHCNVHVYNMTPPSCSASFRQNHQIYTQFIWRGENLLQNGVLIIFPFWLPSGHNCRKKQSVVSVFLRIWHRTLSAELTKTHAFRQFFRRFYPLGNHQVSRWKV